MTETEWLTSTDPTAMLQYLHQQARKPSDRKLRLFACACCRQVWHLLERRCRTAVGLAEQLADGYATSSDVAVLTSSAWHPLVVWRGNDVARGYSRVLHPGDAIANARAAVGVAEMYNTKELAVQASLLRDLFGNPWRPAHRVRTVITAHYPTGDVVLPSVSPSCLAWRNRTIPRIAEAIYQERAWDQMAVLADALEEAGCTDEAILSHCRGVTLYPGCSWPGREQSGWCDVCGTSTRDVVYVPDPGIVHARGCWVVDLLTGRE